MGERERKGSDVVVVGGGAIGLATARALAATGRRILVLERSHPAREASRAAGGMLSPLAEASGPGAFLSLGLDSLALWPSFAAALTDETGVDLDLRIDGKLLLALDPPAVERLRSRSHWLAPAGFAARWLEDAALRAREPAVAPYALAGLHLDHDGQVDNRALGEALAEAAARAGCAVRAESPVQALIAGGGRIQAVRTEDGTMHACETVVLAAGAWSGALAGLPRPLPVGPLKGQMIALASAGGTLRTMVETSACYLIPRRGPAGASIWVGATSEDAGFARGTTATGRAELRRAAQSAVPQLTDAREVEAWAGFRPATPDGLPVLGPDPDLPGLIHATGHFRNGILLTPLTAELIVSCIEGRADARLAPFRADRFPDL